MVATTGAGFEASNRVIWVATELGTAVAARWSAWIPSCLSFIHVLAALSLNCYTAHSLLPTYSIAPTTMSSVPATSMVLSTAEEPAAWLATPTQAFGPVNYFYRPENRPHIKVRILLGTPQQRAAMEKAATVSNRLFIRYSACREQRH